MNAKRTIPFILMTILTAAGCDQSESPTGAEGQDAGASGKADEQTGEFEPSDSCDLYHAEYGNCLEVNGEDADCLGLLAEECVEGGNNEYCDTLDENGYSTCSPEAEEVEDKGYDVFCIPKSQWTCRVSDACWFYVYLPEPTPVDGSEAGVESWQECYDASTGQFRYSTQRYFSGNGTCCEGQSGYRPG